MLERSDSFTVWCVEQKTSVCKNLALVGRVHLPLLLPLLLQEHSLNVKTLQLIWYDGLSSAFEGREVLPREEPGALIMCKLLTATSPCTENYTERRQRTSGLAAQNPRAHRGFSCLSNSDLHAQSHVTRCARHRQP